MADETDVGEQIRNLADLLEVIRDENVELHRGSINIIETNPNHMDVSVTMRLFYGEDSD